MAKAVEEGKISLHNDEEISSIRKSVSQVLIMIIIMHVMRIFLSLLVIGLL